MIAVRSAQASVAGDAMRDVAPFALAVVPFALAIGSASAAAGLNQAEAIGGAVALLAGAGQLAAVNAIDEGSGVVLAASLAVLVNLRFVFYGAGIARWFADAPVRQRLVLAFPIVDQTFALCQVRFETETDLGRRRRYYLTATALLASTFVATQIVGFHVGGELPDGLGLHLAAPLGFAGMLGRGFRERRALVAGVGAVAGFVVLFGALGATALPVAVLVTVVLVQAALPGAGS